MAVNRVKNIAVIAVCTFTIPGVCVSTRALFDAVIGGRRWEGLSMGPRASPKCSMIGKNLDYAHSRSFEPLVLHTAMFT